MKKVNQLIGLLLVVGIVILNAGCAGLVAGGAVAAGSVAYVRGDLKATVESPLESTWKASEQGLRDLEFIVTSTEKDAIEARVEAEGVAKNIKVTMKAIGDTTTDVRIRVGVFGDEEISRRVLDSIRSNL